MSMMLSARPATPVLLALVLPPLALAPAALAQTAAGLTRPLITRSINESISVALAGNTRPEAKNIANDRGIVADSLPMEHVFLQLRRPAAQQQAVQTLIDQLHDPNSPNYHHWLSAAEIGARFGPTQSDIQTITAWLQQQGFTINAVYPNGMLIDFSGAAGRIRAAFHSEIHNLSVDGVAHIANMTDPQIPAALAPAVVGVVALHDFAPHPKYGRKSPANAEAGEFTYSNCSQVLGNTCYPVAPADLATIYNFNPLYSSGITGANQTIYLIEDTNFYNNTDWTTFRDGFGLSTKNFPTASFTTVHPGGCSDPGVTDKGDYQEATIDVEWSTAAAPGATIVLASCAGGYPSGIFTSIQNVVNQTNPPSIVSISYGECETFSGAAHNQAISTAFETGVMEGMSIFVAAGDEGAMSCTSHDNAPSGYGIGVDSMASTPYDVATGGTDFGDTYLGVNSTYWNATNTSNRGSAKSYMPEIPWNSTCGSQLLALSQGYAVTYGSNGFCNSGFVIKNASSYLTGWGGSGGPSACATGTPSVSGVVSGSTCAGWPKPSYQNGMTANDGVRDIPDVSMFASDSPWGHAFMVCSSTPGNPCAGTAPDEWCCWYGTSFTAPIMAGVQALVNQYTGIAWGNPNYRYYQIANAEYGPAGSTICNSTRGNAISSKCVFNDVTMGDEVMPCRADAGSLYNCYLPSGTNGVMSLSNNSYQPAYQTSVGWDFATGIGSINVNNLVRSFNQPFYGLWLTDSHDFNGAGDSDILWRDSSGNVGMWLMNGSSILQTNVLGNVSAVWSAVGQRDFNGDGNSDILWRDTSGNVGMWLMNGTQIASATVLGAVPTTWSVAATGDFNADGKGDLVWRDTSGNVGIWLMNGTQVLSTKVLGNAPLSWVVAGADMKGDIFWRNLSTGEVGIWVVNGTAISQTVDFGVVPLNWTLAGVGDFDGNGSTDLLWRDSQGNVGVWFMNGLQIMSSKVLGNVPLTWTIAQTGDYNGDGKSDILWTDISGDVGVWLMNGATISSTTTFGNVGTTWIVQSLNAE
jgi:hypothetical protein